MKIILSGIFLILFSFNANSQMVVSAETDEKPDINSEIFKGVMHDSLAQFNYHRSQTEFLFPDRNREESFFKSFGEREYQGVITTKNFGKVEYVTQNAVIIWHARSERFAESGTLDMNEFIFQNHPELFPNGNNRFVCGGLCIGAIGIAIAGASCAIFNSQCNNRCSQIVCPAGSTKVCESSCATGYCGTACQHMDPDLLSTFNAPWSGGAWNSYPFSQWDSFLTDGTGGGGGHQLIGK